ncbi:MAG TPA: hypothetical protein VK638_23495 [Edaphobacter sp.]|nr:hypothetical protein [Edaphobacter sp.]
MTTDQATVYSDNCQITQAGIAGLKGVGKKVKLGPLGIIAGFVSGACVGIKDNIYEYTMQGYDPPHLRLRLSSNWLGGLDQGTDPVLGASKQR